jgi:hypothetical protein
MCKEIQETPKSCPVSSPYATPTLTAALSAEYSTGAATVHHLQQHGVRRQEVLSRNPADGTPHRVTVHSADWPGFHETVAHGPRATTCAPGLPGAASADPIGEAPDRLLWHPETDLGPGRRSPGGGVVRVHVDPLTRVTPESRLQRHAAAELEFKAGIRVGVALTDRPLAPSSEESQVPSRPTVCAKSCADRSESDTWAAIF